MITGQSGRPAQSGRAGSVTVPGILLGIGLGGFVDGILLHQILQWHHMLSASGSYPVDTVRGLEVNTLWDGLFHATTWLFVLVGLFLLWRALADGTRHWSFRTLSGPLLVGWGVFNLVEGVVDHHVLSIHHVRDDVANPLWWDLGFLALGVSLILGGLALRGATQRRDSDLGQRPDHER